MGRKLLFHQLKTEKGWPFSRQYTDELVKAGKIPPPEKRPGAKTGSRNFWDEDIWDRFHDAFVSTRPRPIWLELTAALVDALSTTSIDGVVNAVERLRVILEHEGAAASDVVVTLKASLTAPAPTQATNEATAITDTS